MCDRQKLQGRFPRVAYSMFPAFYRIGAHIDDPSENCLARLEGVPDGSDLGGCERLWRGLYVGNPQCSLLTLLVSQSLMQRLFQITEHFHCLFLWFSQSTPYLLLPTCALRPTKMACTTFAWRIRSSAVTSGTPSTMAVAAISRSAGSFGKPAGNRTARGSSALRSKRQVNSGLVDPEFPLEVYNNRRIYV